MHKTIRQCRHLLNRKSVVYVAALLVLLANSMAGRGFPVMPSVAQAGVEIAPAPFNGFNPAP